MDALTVINALVIGLFFTIWKRGDLLNFTIKFSLLVLLVVNIMRLCGKV